MSFDFSSIIYFIFWLIAIIIFIILAYSLVYYKYRYLANKYSLKLYKSYKLLLLSIVIIIFLMIIILLCSI